MRKQWINDRKRNDDEPRPRNRSERSNRIEQLRLAELESDTDTYVPTDKEITEAVEQR